MLQQQLCHETFSPQKTIRFYVHKALFLMYKHEKMFEKNYTKACVTKLLLSDSNVNAMGVFHPLDYREAGFAVTVKVTVGEA